MGWHLIDNGSPTLSVTAVLGASVFTIIVDIWTSVGELIAIDISWGVITIGAEKNRYYELSNMNICLYDKNL